jgi:DNA-binding NtrC family response regulator
MNKPDVHLSSATMDLFARFWWPGNVRQLRNEVHRAVAMSAPGGTIEPEHLSPELSSVGLSIPADRQGAAPLGAQAASLAAAIEQVERDYIAVALDRTGRNITAAARMLGLTRRGLYLKMSRLGVSAPN